MPKRIQVIRDLISKAERNGESRIGSYDARYFEKEDIIVIQHYGTVIYRQEKGIINKLGGYSQSDGNAILTAMEYYGHRGYVSNNKKDEKLAVRKLDGWYFIPNN